MFFQRSLIKNVFKGDKSPRYCLTIMMNPPKRVLKAQLRKHAERPAHGVEEKRQGHALVVDPGCWLGSKNRQNVAFKLTPAPCWLPFMPLGSLLVGKTLTVSTTSTTGAEGGVQTAG